jgi:carbamoyl-phosphate synthase large subunit
MGDLITVMVTGGGAPGIAGTIYALRNNPDGNDFRIITTDIKDDVVGGYLADEFYKISPPENEEYSPRLTEIALKEKVKAIIPQTTREVAELSRNIEKFAKLGIIVIASPSESIRIANDKFLLLEKAKHIGVPYPAYYLSDSKDSLLKAVESLGYPERKVVVKPRVSNGMRGLRILTKEAWDVQRFLNMKPEGVQISLETLMDILSRGSWPELLVTEYLPGPEYTIDIFRGKKGSVVIPRLRAAIRSGITFEATVDLRSDLLDYSKKLAEGLNLVYCFGFQFKLSADNIPKLLESNPRVQGTMVVGAYTGFNMIYYSVREALGRLVEVDNFKLKNEIKFKRYWGGIGIDGSRTVGKI